MPAPVLASPAPAIPPLRNGDHLTRDEFERRYEAMPDLKKAELIEGVVYMPSPGRALEHGSPHAAVVTWLGVYWAQTPARERVLAALQQGVASSEHQAFVARLRQTQAA